MQGAAALVLQSIDDLDRKIVQYLCHGIYSYQDLAKKCGVTRNTVYRRIAFLEKNGFIERTTRAVLNYDKLGVTAIAFGAGVNQPDFDAVTGLLKAHNNVKLLLRTFGRHNVVFVAFCNKGDEGNTINSIKEMLEGFNVSDIDVSVGFAWEKTDFCIP
jgi:DNA-binding Lrp family transcriptional regulator